MKEKILNEVKQQFSPSNQGDKINAELVKSLREQIENLQSEILFLRQEMKEKILKMKVKMIIHLNCSFREMALSSPIYRQCQFKNASEKTLSTNKTYQNDFKNNLPILATEEQARIMTQM